MQNILRMDRAETTDSPPHFATPRKGGPNMTDLLAQGREQFEAAIRQAAADNQREHAARVAAWGNVRSDLTIELGDIVGHLPIDPPAWFDPASRQWQPIAVYPFGTHARIRIEIGLTTKGTWTAKRGDGLFCVAAQAQSGKGWTVLPVTLDIACGGNEQLAATAFAAFTAEQDYHRMLDVSHPDTASIG